MILKILKSFILSASLLGASIAFAQDITSEFEQRPSITNESEEIFSEKVKIISRSGKTFILTNSNQLLSKGDFITMLFRKDGPIARAVVAKNHKDLVGVKILKVYSLKRWSRIKRNIEVDILKGDDSSLFKKVEEVPKEEQAIIDETIDDEEDLFNDTGIEDRDVDSFDTLNRNIKPDNIVSAGWSRFVFQNTITSNTETGNQFNFAWAYQFADNFWLEGLYGRTSLQDIPDNGLGTIVNNVTVRLKYTFKAPLYSYLMPYIGFQTTVVSSPNAGDTDDEDKNNKEIELIDSLKKNNVAIGATFLKRLVPGWFLKVNLGNDIFNLGVGVEF